MSLETAEDARRILDFSRVEYGRLMAYLQQLPPDGWTEQSACAEWPVHKAVSHLGSQAQIHGLRLKAGLGGDRPMTDEQRNAVWDHFDSLKPGEMLPAFRQANDDFMKLADSLSDDDLVRRILWNTPEPTPVVTAIVGRLNEQVLHAWDIEWARDREAVLAPSALKDLLELNLSPARLRGLVKVEEAAELAGKTVQLVLSDPDAVAYLELQADGAKGSSGRASSRDLTVEMATEAFIRFVWGRYSITTGLATGQVKLSRAELAGEFQRLFPGR